MYNIYTIIYKEGEIYLSILDNLNNMQKKAAEILEGQTLILAGDGSGKTRTITFKIAHMIK